MNLCLMSDVGSLPLMFALNISPDICTWNLSGQVLLEPSSARRSGFLCRRYRWFRSVLAAALLLASLWLVRRATDGGARLSAGSVSDPGSFWQVRWPALAAATAKYSEQTD